MNKKPLALLVASACLAVPSLSSATTGYFAGGYGTKNKAFSGGGIALPQDAMIAATNPAGMAFVGNRMDLGAALFSPRRNYTASDILVDPTTGDDPAGFWVAPGNHDSDSEWFLIPHFAYNRMLDDVSSVGISVYGNGGMNSDYDIDAQAVQPSPTFDATGTFTGFSPVRGTGVFGENPTGIDLSQLFINLSYAQKFMDTASWGASLIFAAQAFEAEGLGNFTPFTESFNEAFASTFTTTGSIAQAFQAGSAATDSLTDNGHELAYGAGVKVGIQGDVLPGLTLAASYQSKIYMTEFDDYEDLFAEGGDFDIPATATIGLAWRATPSLVAVFDIQHIWYSDVDSINNPFANINNCPVAVFQQTGTFSGDTSSCLGGDDGAGFGWDDIFVYKIGLQWQSSPEWTWRVGYSHNDQPIPESEVLFNILAPATIEDMITAGFTKKMGKNNELSFSAMYAFEESVKGTNPFAGNAQEIEIEMSQFELEASWAWIWD